MYGKAKCIIFIFDTLKHSILGYRMYEWTIENFLFSTNDSSIPSSPHFRDARTTKEAKQSAEWNEKKKKKETDSRGISRRWIGGDCPRQTSRRHFRRLRRVSTVHFQCGEDNGLELGWVLRRRVKIGLRLAGSHYNNSEPAVSFMAWFRSLCHRAKPRLTYLSL